MKYVISDRLLQKYQIQLENVNDYLYNKIFINKN